jgi:hypothetical protein
MKYGTHSAKQSTSAIVMAVEVSIAEFLHVLPLFICKL